jgi:hypothetical protein
MLTRALLATLVTAVVTAVSVTPFQSGAATREGPVTVDTIVHDAALIGNLQRDATGRRVWLDGAEPHVGTIDGRQSRPLITFDITAIPSGATIVSAHLVLDQCAIVGMPFVGAAHVIVDHLLAATAPDSATFDAAPSAATAAQLPTDATPGRRVVTVTASVAADYRALRALTQFRLRLDGTTGFVAFRGDGDDDCPAVPEAAPMLIVTYRR